MTLSIEDLINEAKFILTEHDKNNPYFDLESTLKQLIHDMEKHEDHIIAYEEQLQENTKELRQAQEIITNLYEMHQDLIIYLNTDEVAKNPNPTNTEHILMLVVAQLEEVESADYYLSL